MKFAEQVESRAAQFLMRRDEEDWSYADEAELTAWLAESWAHKAAYWRLEEIWRRADRLGALYEPLKPYTFASLARRPSMPLAVAASLLLALFVLVTWPKPRPVQVAQLETRIGERRTFHLIDGSAIDLNTNTRIRIAFEHARRVAWVSDGEAYFRIAHDPGRPFVVHAGARDLSVLGTKFLVRSDGDSLSVAVVEGAVQLSGVGPSVALGSTVLRGGSMAVVKGTTTLVSLEPADQLKQRLSWRDGVIVLDGSTLGQALTEFNRYTTTPAVLEDEHLAKMPIGGSFQLDNQHGFIRLLSQVYELRMDQKDGKLILRR